MSSPSSTSTEYRSGLSLAASASRTSLATLFSERPLLTPTFTSTASPWRGVTRKWISPVVRACPLISMRHLLEVGEASAKAKDANNRDAMRPAATDPDFMRTSPRIVEVAVCGFRMPDGIRRVPERLSVKAPVYLQVSADLAD